VIINAIIKNQIIYLFMPPPFYREKTGTIFNSASSSYDIIQ